MNQSRRRVVCALVAGCFMLAAGVFLPRPASAVAAATWQSPSDLDVAVGVRLLPLAVGRGGQELALETPDGAYLRRIFDRLAGSARITRPLPYSLHVLSATDRADAWSLSDGSVFVTAALLQRLPTVDEVAAALAHQLAHAALRHNLDDVTSAEGRALLDRVATGAVPAARESLGRLAPAVLGEFYPVSDERAADRLAAGWLREAGYRADAGDLLSGRLAGLRTPYLETHPHPGLRPTAGLPAGPPALVIEGQGPGSAPAPLPPATTLPAPAPARTYLPPAVPLRAAPHSEFAPVLSLVGGYYPLHNEREVTGSIQLRDWRGETGSWLYPEVERLDSALALGSLVEVPFSAGWEGVLGLGGLAGGPSMVGQRAGGGGFLLGGVLQHGSGDGLRWAAGPYVGVTWAAAPVGRLVDPRLADPFSPWNWLEYDSDIVDWGTPVTARTALATVGGLLTVSGDTPVQGLTWFATVGAQNSAGGNWHYYAPGAYTGQEVELEFTGVNASPLSATGVLALGGLALRF